MAVVYTDAVRRWPNCLTRQAAYLVLSNMCVVSGRMLVQTKPIEVREAWEDVIITLMVRDEIAFIKSNSLGVPEAAFRGDVDF